MFRILKLLMAQQNEMKDILGRLEKQPSLRNPGAMYRLANGGIVNDTIIE